MNILTVNLLFSTLVFWIAAKLYLVPRLHKLKPRSVLLPILLLPAYWIPAFWVPALLVTHYITFIILLRYWKGAA